MRAREMEEETGLNISKMEFLTVTNNLCLEESTRDIIILVLHM